MNPGSVVPGSGACSNCGCRSGRGDGRHRGIDDEPVPAHARRAGDPPHPDPVRHALDQRKVEAFWAILQEEVLDRQHLADLAVAEAAVTAYATYYNYHRLHGQPGWQTRPSGSRAPCSPIEGSSASLPSPTWRTSSPSCRPRLPEVSHYDRGTLSGQRLCHLQSHGDEGDDHLG